MCQGTSKIHAHRAALLFAGSLLLASGPALAEDSPNILTDSWDMSLGTFTVNTDTQLEFDGKTSTGTKFNWESTFGGGDETRVRFDGHWRFGDSDRHKLRWMWFNASNRNSKVLERNIEWGGQTYPIGAKVEGEFKFDIYELAYEYAFLHHDTWELNASAGLHWASVSATLKARANNSNGTLLVDQHKEGAVDLPLPVFGVRGLWQLPHNFFIDAQAQYFSLSIDEYDGSVTDYKIDAVWQPNRWVGIGLGYNYFKVDVDVNKKFNGSLNWAYDGPMISYNILF
jgi:hypothetical protein